MAKRKRRKRNRLKQLVNERQSDRIIPMSDLLAGKGGISESGRELLQEVFSAVMASPCEAELIAEARGYGYPLKKILDFYIALNESFDPADFAGISNPYSDGSDFETGTRNILENLKSVETWEDFAPFIEYWRVPREADDESLLIPPDMVSMIVDRRMIQSIEKKMIKLANEAEPKDAVAYLAAEHVRRLKGVSVEIAAHALEMSPGVFELWIEALSNRVSQDEEMSGSLSIINRRNSKRYE